MNQSQLEAIKKVIENTQDTECGKVHLRIKHGVDACIDTAGRTTITGDKWDITFSPAGEVTSVSAALVAEHIVTTALQSVGLSPSASLYLALGIKIKPKRGRK